MQFVESLDDLDYFFLEDFLDTQEEEGEFRYWISSYDDYYDYPDDWDYWIHRDCEEELEDFHEILLPYQEPFTACFGWARDSRVTYHKGAKALNKSWRLKWGRPQKKPRYKNIDRTTIRKLF